MSAFNELANRIKETESIIPSCENNHEALGLPDYVSDLEISTLQQRLTDLKRQADEEADMQLEELEIRMEPPNLPSGSKEEEATLQGRLTGINVRTNSFELCVEDGAKITGRIVKETVSKSVIFVNKICRAKLLNIPATRVCFFIVRNS